jgi:hypothetical protein
MEVCGFFLYLVFWKNKGISMVFWGYSRKCFTCVFAHKCEVFNKMIGLEILRKGDKEIVCHMMSILARRYNSRKT